MARFHESSFDDRELIKALQEAEAPRDEESSPGLTRWELKEKTGLGDMALAKQLQEGVASGRITVGRRIVKNVAGAKAQIPVYNFVGDKKSKKKPKKR